MKGKKTRNVQNSREIRARAAEIQRDFLQTLTDALANRDRKLGELQSRCPHYDSVRYSNPKPYGTGKTRIICQDCGMDAYLD